MSRQPRRIAWLAVAATIAAAFAGAMLIAGGLDCEFYYPSHPEWMPYVGQYCAGWGSGCTECYNSGNGDSCTTEATSCDPRPHLEHKPH